MDFVLYLQAFFTKIMWHTRNFSIIIIIVLLCLLFRNSGAFLVIYSIEYEVKST